MKTGLLVGDGGSLTDLPARLRELYPVGLAQRVRADYLAPHYRLAALGVLRRAAAAGLPCLLWTVNSPELIRKYATDPRVAAIITDVAAQAVEIVAGVTGLPAVVLLSRREWAGLRAPARGACRPRAAARARHRGTGGRGRARRCCPACG